MKQLVEIQILRAIAATAVIFGHALGRTDRTFPGLQEEMTLPFSNMVVFGHFGVDLFFVISGFVMVYAHSSMYGQKGAPLAFLLKRIRRIVPIYWLLTAAAVLLLLVRPEIFSKRTGIEWDWVVASFMFIPWETSYGVDAPVLGVGWTLNYEMYFYSLFAISLLLSKRSGLLLMSLFLTISVAVGVYLKPERPLAEMIFSPLLLEFVVGCFLAMAFLRKSKTAFRYGYLLAACGAAMLVASFFYMPESHLDRLLWRGVPSALLVAGTLGMEWPRSKIIDILARLGDASYSAYLVHVFSLPAIAMLFKFLQLNNYLGLIGLSVLTTAITWMASLVFWKLVEKKISRMLAGGVARRGKIEIESSTGA